MIDPIFIKHFTKMKTHSEHGFEYVVLDEKAPVSVKERYERYIKEQDDRVKKGKPVLY